MNGLFKNAFWYIIEEMACVMVNILKYVPRVQEVDEEVHRKPWDLRHVYVSDYLKDQGICEWVVYKNLRMVEYVPDHFKTREMCNDVVMKDPLLLRHVPDWLSHRNN